MLFARFDWFLYLGISSTLHLLAVSGEKMAREPHFVVKYSSYLGTAIKLVLYILKQLFASVSVTSGGYLPRRSGSVNIHRYSPPLLRIIVNYSSRWGWGWCWHWCWWCGWGDGDLKHDAHVNIQHFNSFLYSKCLFVVYFYAYLLFTSSIREARSLLTFKSRLV